MYNGLIVLDKIDGALSRACVSSVSKILGRKHKLGHAGTLDSSASGVLVLLAGYATRLCDAVMNLPKSYLATVQFGWETSTDDGTGEHLSKTRAADYDEKSLLHALPGFLGVRLQRPPRISAVFVNGKRAHKIARSGEEPQISPRPVNITSIDYQGRTGVGQCRLLVRCHKGTYVRSLARDLGRVLGIGAHLAALRRLSVGNYDCAGALPFNPQEPLSADGLAPHIRPVSTLAEHYCCYTANDFCEQRLINGLGVYLSYLKFRNAGVVPVEQGVIVLGKKNLCVGALRNEGQKCIVYPQANIPLEVRID